MGGDNDVNVQAMITRLMWTIWTSLSAVRERPLNLITHSLTHHIVPMMRKGFLRHDVIVIISHSATCEEALPESCVKRHINTLAPLKIFDLAKLNFECISMISIYPRGPKYIVMCLINWCYQSLSQSMPWCRPAASDCLDQCHEDLALIPSWISNHMTGIV